jgi:hypothetical protein
MYIYLLRATLTYLREMTIMSNAMPDKHRGREISNVRKILGANHVRGNVPTEATNIPISQQALVACLRKLLSRSSTSSALRL